MRAKRTIVIGGLLASLAGGGAALAARSEDDADKAEQAILGDAAKRLGVSAQELEDALAKAEDAQLEQAVKDGDLTRRQADAIKRHRRESGRVLGFPGGPPGGGPGFGGPGFGGPGRHHHSFGGPGEVFDAVAKELGISTDDLFAELRKGKSLAQVAKAHGKTLADVRAAARKAAEEQLDKAVEDGDLTAKQADELRSRLPDLLKRLGQRPRFRPGFGPPPGGGGPGFGPPPIRG